MTQKPLVSIGVPVRNGGDYLQEALEQVVNQTYRNIEIVISDNNSTDKTPEICKSFQKQDTRIKYFPQNEKINAIQNFRFVAEHSTGDYFMWAAHDDRRDLNYVEVLLERMLKEPGASIVFSDVAIFQDFSEWASAKPLDYDFECRMNDSYWRKIRERKYIKPGFLHIYGLIRREKLLDYNWIQIEISPDKPLLLYLSCRGDFIKTEGTCIYIYSPRIKKKDGQRAVDNFYTNLKPFPRLRLSWVCAKTGTYAEKLEERNRSTTLSFALFLYEGVRRLLGKVKRFLEKHLLK